jgi:hypothetical protein
MFPEPAPRPGFGWKLLNSWWILFSILGFGCLSGTGFLLIGLRARKPWWSGSGIAYLFVGSALFVLAGRYGTDGAANGGLAALWFVIWFVSVVHSFVLNVYWLRWQEAHRPASRRPYGSSPAWNSLPNQSGLPPGFATDLSGHYDDTAVPASPARAGPISVPPAFGAPSSGAPSSGESMYNVPSGQPDPTPTTAFPSTSTTWGSSPPWQPAGPAPAGPGSGQPATGWDTSGFAPLDVNTATAAQLGTLAELDQGRAAYVLAERDRRAGFGSLEEFATVAQLAPHQFALLRSQLTCTPRY